MNNWKKTIKTLKTSSKGSLDKPEVTNAPSSSRSESPGAQCGIGSIVEFEFDGQLLTGTVAAFGRYGLIHIATDPSRPMFHHRVGQAFVKRIIKLV